jgi:hypothetical protein
MIRMPRSTATTLAAVLLPALAAHSVAAVQSQPRYVWAKAYHVLPETHNNESGYFSLCEGLDGRVYVGTAKYGVNAYLVEFDPVTERQKVVVDVHKLCGLSASGYAAQAKIHTRNFVGPSGKVYFGSKQGYPQKGDTSKYPGGYLMTYDPRTGKGENLGMPLAGQGIIDVMADEKRGLIYVVTCEDQHWMVYDCGARKYRDLGPMLTPYASTLIDAAGGACAITRDFQLARYDPASSKVTVRPIAVDGKPFRRAGSSSIPTWVLSADARKAWLILMNDPTLLEVDLVGKGKVVHAVAHGRMVEGKGPDSRCALALGPDGRVYAVVRVDNETGFGKGYLHHLARFDPQARKMEDLGVLAVKNPGFFDFGAGKDGKKPPWSHGYHKLPDGTLTPLYHHMALIAAADGTLYVTIIAPFSLLRIDAFRRPAAPAGPAGRYIDAALRRCDAAEKHLPEFTRVAQIVADRHIAGGQIGLPWNGQTLAAELYGRSGNIMHVGFDRPWKKDRTDAEKGKDVAIIGWDRAPGAGDAKTLADLRKRGCYVVGFGPRDLPELARLVPLCDAFFDTGLGSDDRVVALPGSRRAGRANHLVNAIHGWVFSAELVAALTRRGRMPTMWKAWACEDGRQWGERYFGKKQFHDDYSVAPIPAGRLGREYLDRIRHLLRRFRRRELGAVKEAAELIAAEARKGRKTIVASTGHMAMAFIARYEDAAWARNMETHYNVKAQMDGFAKNAPDGALVLRLGYLGMHRDVADLLRSKRARVVHIAAENPRPEFQPPADLAVTIDVGYAFGDACVPVEGYPLLLFAPSGVMQVAAYEAVNVEVLARLGGPGAPAP